MIYYKISNGKISDVKLKSKHIIFKKLKSQIKVPAPLLYASKLARLVGESIGMTQDYPNQPELADTLYYI